MEAHRFGVAVTHRRFGKSVCAVNHLQRAALKCRLPRPRFGYIAPTYTQGKANVWDYMKFYARPVPSGRVHESELRVDYPNGGQVRIFGADNPDSLRGLYFDGVVLDEYGLHPSKIFSEVIAPELSDRGGWALFLGTPNGKNEFYDKVQKARNDPRWFFAEFKASQTGILSEAELLLARDSMSEDEYLQEYECSFEASVKGAIYMRELQSLRERGQFARVPYDPQYLVNTDWDIGHGDGTAIWFTQQLDGGRTHVIDFYSASGYGLPHFRDVLNSKPYVYGTHWGPHDIEVTEWGVGLSRVETASRLGLHFQVVPKVSLDDGIHNTRMILPKCWFDAERCAKGIEALKNYRWDYNTHLKDFTHLPLHDWASHAADALRGLATRYVMGTGERVQPPPLRKDVDPYDAHRQAQRGNRRMGRGGY